jgi:hypothetical protein
MNTIKLLVSSALAVLTCSVPQAIYGAENISGGWERPLPNVIFHEMFDLAGHEDLRDMFNEFKKEPFVPREALKNSAELKNFLFFVNKSPLSNLDIRFKGIDDERLKTIAEVLIENTSLKELRLRDISIGDVGIQAIAKMLEANKTITTLDMQGAYIGIEGAKAIAQMLEENDTLTTLNLRGSSIDPEGLQAIIYVLLKENQTLSTLNLESCNIGATEAQAMREILSERPIRSSLKLEGNFWIRDVEVRAIKKTSGKK